MDAFGRLRFLAVTVISVFPLWACDLPSFFGDSIDLGGHEFELSVRTILILNDFLAKSSFSLGECLGVYDLCATPFCHNSSTTFQTCGFR